MTIINKTYEIKYIEDIGLLSYTQHPFSKLGMYKLNNLYFMKNNIDKLNLIYDVVSNGDYVIFDTETNGLNNFGESLPFQIAAIKYRNGEEINRLNIIINIGKIPEEILTMTNFKQEDIDNGLSLEEAMNIFNTFVNGEKYIIAHNASFDISIINNLMVATNTYISSNIDVLCSMQMYYTIYKHIFGLGISGSNLDQLSNILLGINLDEEKRHQADYDVIITKELLNKIYVDISYDLAKNENSEIEKVKKIEENINDKINYVSQYPKSEKTIAFMHDIGKKIDNLYNDYYDNYYIPNTIIANTITKFLKNTTGNEFPEIFLRDELQNITYYIKKRQPYLNPDKNYLNKWTRTFNEYVSSRGHVISFFILDNNYDLFSDDVIVNNEESLAYYLDLFVEQKNKMMKIQREIQYLLKIIKTHEKIVNLSLYGNENKNNYIKSNMHRENGYNERYIDSNAIISDIKKGLVKNKDDLLSYDEYNTALLVEENLFTKIKNQ